MSVYGGDSRPCFQIKGGGFNFDLERPAGSA